MFLVSRPPLFCSVILKDLYRRDRYLHVASRKQKANKYMYLPQVVLNYVSVVGCFEFIIDTYCRLFSIIHLSREYLIFGDRLITFANN